MIEHTLWGDVDKVQVAIERLRMFEPPEGYYLAFSGGKDSQAIYRLAELAGVKFAAHYNDTTVDPPELRRFIRAQYPTVLWDKPKRSMFQLIEHYHAVPDRYRRFCCQSLKEVHSVGIVVMGVRWEESARRAKRKMVELCRNDPTKTFVSPIIDWTADEVWAFLNDQGLPHCSLYDEGFKRIGCIMCPLKQAKDRRRDAERWPKYYEAYRKAVARAVATGKRKSPKTVDEIMEWWLSDPQDVEPAEQCSFLGIMEAA